MIVTSVVGHMMELDFGPAYKAWNGRSPISLFDAPLEKSVKQVMAL